MQLEEQSFDRPIPGQSMTTELGGRPWEQPSEFSNVDDAASYYIQLIANDDFSKNLIHAIKMNVPLSVIANSIQLAGVMEGKHSVDVGILMIPIIMETMMLIADSAGVEYNTGLAKGDAIDQDIMATNAINELVNKAQGENSSEFDSTEQDILEEQEEEKIKSEEVSSGLMSRRV